MDQDAAMILLTCLSYTDDADKAGKLAQVTAEEWRKVVDLAHQHKVAPLLYHHIRHLKVALPDELFKELEQAHAQNTFRNMGLYQELNKLLGWLGAENIPVIVLKGAYLANAVYEDVGLRIMSDIDILVKQEDVLRVERELMAWGYLPNPGEDVNNQDSYHFRYTLTKINCIIEIHWKLLQSYFPFQVDTEELWNRAQPVTLAQIPTLTLSPDDTLLHLCLHIVKHAYKFRIKHDTRISTLSDVGEVVRRYGSDLNWQEIGARAHQWGTVCAVYLILRLAQELLGVPVPTAWLVSLKPETFDESYILVARKETFTPSNDGYVERYNRIQAARLWWSGGVVKKSTLFFQSLFQSRENMAEMYPVPAKSLRIFLYYPVRFKDILVRHTPMMWRLFRADQEINTQDERTNQLNALHDWLMSG